MIHKFINSCSNSPTSQIKYPTTISVTKPPILTQQFTTYFQLSQEAWKQLNNQMNEKVKTNKLLKKAIQGTYKNNKCTATGS